MPGSVGGDRPGWLIGIRNFQVDRARLVAQSERAGAAERAGVRPHRIDSWINRLNVLRHFRDHEIGARTHDRIWWKRIVDVSAQAVSTDVLEERIGVVQLNKFK